MPVSLSVCLYVCQSVQTICLFIINGATKYLHLGTFRFVKLCSSESQWQWMAPGKQLREFCGWCLLLSYADIKFCANTSRALMQSRSIYFKMWYPVLPPMPPLLLHDCFLERLKCMKSRLESKFRASGLALSSL